MKKLLCSILISTVLFFSTITSANASIIAGSSMECSPVVQQNAYCITSAGEIGETCPCNGECIPYTTGSWGVQWCIAQCGTDVMTCNITVLVSYIDPEEPPIPIDPGSGVVGWWLMAQFALIGGMWMAEQWYQQLQICVDSYGPEGCGMILQPYNPMP